MIASQPTPPAIELVGAFKRFGREAVLGGVSLTVTPGRFVVLRGGNGAGKTTLLRVIATRLRLTAGEGRVFGHDLKRQSAEVRRMVAYFSVAGGSYPLLSARENLALAARLHGLSVDADALLERVGLAEAEGKLVRTFSSGMKKRLALARLLLPNAPLWLLDEPYTTLDEAGRDLVDEVLTEALTSGTTVLMATHEEQRPGAPQPDALLSLSGGELSVLARPRPEQPGRSP